METIVNLSGALEQAKIKLDKRDEKLLAILAEDSRTPISIIAKTLGINRDTVKYKMNRLEETGIIKNYVSDIDNAYFGYITCHVFLLIDEVDKEKRTQMIEELIRHPYTISVLEYNDKWDVEWVFVAKGILGYDQIMSGLTQKYLDSILERDTLILLADYPTTILPFELNRPKSKEKSVKGKAKIDDKDIAILRLIANHARMNAVEIADKINISSDAVIKRIKQLKGQGIIKKFSIECDRNKMGYHWYSIAVRMKHFGKKQHEKLRELVRQHPHIVHCVKTMGLWDLYLYICTKEVIHFHDTVKMLKKEFAENILQCDSWMLYKDHGFTSFPSAIVREDVKDS